MVKNRVSDAKSINSCHGQARSGGGGTPFPLDMHPPRARDRLYLLNSKLTNIFRFFSFLINRQYHNFSILLHLKLFLAP